MITNFALQKSCQMPKILLSKKRRAPTAMHPSRKPGAGGHSHTSRRLENVFGSLTTTCLKLHSKKKNISISIPICFGKQETGDQESQWDSWGDRCSANATPAKPSFAGPRQGGIAPQPQGLKQGVKFVGRVGGPGGITPPRRSSWGSGGASPPAGGPGAEPPGIFFQVSLQKRRDLSHFSLSQ